MRRYLFEAAPLCLLAAGLYMWLSVRPGFVGNISDTAFYLTVADYFSPYWQAPPGLGASLFYDFSFPPLYPLLLAMLGGGSEHPAQSYIATSVMMASAVGAVYVWLRTERLSVAQAMGLTVVFAVLPASLLAVMVIQSEPLYVALTFAGLALWGMRERGTSMCVLAALCIGSSALARTVGLSAIGALLIHWFIDKDARKHMYVPVLAVGPYLGWALVKYVNGMQSSYVNSVLHGSLTDTVASVLNQIAVNLPAMWISIVHSFDLAGTHYATVTAAVFLALSAFGWALRLRSLKIDTLYAVLYLMIIVVWPFPDHMRRFLQVLFPLFLFYSYSGVRQMTKYIAPDSPRMVGNAFIAMLAIVLAPSTLLIVQQVAQAEGTDSENFVRSPQWYRYNTPLRATETMNRVMQIMDGIRGIDEHLPSDACVSSAAYAYIPLYGRRRSRPIALESSTDAQLFSELRACPYVFMMAATAWPDSEYPAMYPHERIKDRLEVVEVSLWDRAATTGTVLTMLGRVRFDEDGWPPR